MTTSGRAARAIGLTVAALLLLAGCAAPEPETAPEQRASDTPRPTPTSTAFTDPREALDALAARVAPAPVSLSIPDLGIEMDVLPQGLDERGAMALPASAFDAGWYEYSAGPGASQGATVLASHVFTVAEGEGPFLRLLDAQPGQLVAVVDAEGVRHEYRISMVEQISKDVVPLDRVFTSVGDPHLVMVTCGGDYDYGYAGGRGRYEDNVIITAERLS
ncbi:MULTISPECIES: class F sortase [unclassified Microcella]|uniref:class F sortase n=1 Tax=unclassified Microcella TaxID=2630066 RepID=UPI0006FA9671|nr:MULTISPECIES: class F sortase [unclassified Microcella]KQV26656.1 hypothetical protein ASC54_07340 [Yonghaparkia sp. Root332]KRF32566.1 hypothetical protein ASG83_00390 [Yonghaparkia sp. Soil809]